MDKVYLGDGVYVEFVDGQFVLTTENGIEVTNTIYFEDNVISNLLKYFRKLGIKLEDY